MQSVSNCAEEIQSIFISKECTWFFAKYDEREFARASVWRI